MYRKPCMSNRAATAMSPVAEGTSLCYSVIESGLRGEHEFGNLHFDLHLDRSYLEEVKT